MLVFFYLGRRGCVIRKRYTNGAFVVGKELQEKRRVVYRYAYFIEGCQ